MDENFDEMSISAIKEFSGDLCAFELMNASVKAKSEHVNAIRANLKEFEADLKVDELAYDSIKTKYESDEDKKHDNLVSALEILHESSWTATEQFLDHMSPVMVEKTQDLWSNLPGQFNEWEVQLPFGARSYVWIYWVLLPTCGSVNSIKLDWFADFVTDKLATNPHNSDAIVFQTNRASDDVDAKVKSQTKAEHDDQETEDDGDADDDDELDMKSSTSPSKLSKKARRLGTDKTVWVRQKQVRDKFEGSSRKLRVRDVMVIFDPKSVYGKRTAVQQCFLCTANVDGNVFHRSVAWKDRLVRGVLMLPRDMIVRPHFSTMDNNSGAAHLSKSMTDVQEYKQHCGGINIISKIQAALLHDNKGGELAPSSHIGHVDMHGYDGGISTFALQSLERSLPERVVASCTICHGREEYEFVKRNLLNTIHSMGERKAIPIPGFPDIGKV